jgi:hypothetical protein
MFLGYRDAREFLRTRSNGYMVCYLADRLVENVVLAREAIRAARVKDGQWTTTPFLAACQALFKAHPRLKSFAWRQYTPFFKGDSPSRFTVFSSEPDINGPEMPGASAEETLQGLVAEFLDGFHDEMEGMFGDHVRVTVYRDGTTETQQVDHD